MLLTDQTKHVTALPAYGRDYRNQREVLEAWDKGLDFKITSHCGGLAGKYLNKEDAENFNLTDVFIRYSNKQKVVGIKI